LNYVSTINGSSLFTLISNDSTATHHWQTNSGFGFQDLYNAGQYSGVTSSTLTVSNTSLQNNNQLFRCIVTTPNCGSDTSDIVTLTVSSSGQGPALPRKFNYQAVVRDSMGALITNRNVSLRVTLLRGSAPHSPELFKETHQANTNATGLLTVKIGNGQSILGSMDSIDWSQGMVYLRTEIDPTGGNTFSVVNTAELLSVPYALYSLNSGGGPSGPAGPQGPMGLQGPVGPQGPSGGSCPVGTIQIYAGNVPPQGWLICDGSPISRISYSSLFSIIGTSFGDGDGSNVTNWQDLNNDGIVDTNELIQEFITFNLPDFRGKGPMGFLASDTSFNLVGKNGGTKNHTLTESEIPAHTIISSISNRLVSTYTAWVNAVEEVTTRTYGGGMAHNILDPYLTVKFIIKY
jgi:microcystin-dependent protein